LEAAFQYIEQAKSRRLADLIAFRAQALPAQPAADRPLVEQVRGLREELSWDYGRLDQHETGAERQSAAHLEHLRERARQHEAQLLKALAELHKSDEEFVSLQGAATTPLPLIRLRLPADAALVEYYLARGTVHGCVVTREDIKVVALGPAARVRQLFGEWRRLGTQANSSKEPLDDVLKILKDLHAELFSPLRPHIQAKQLVIVPDDFLHHFPFHALFDGERFLIDDFRISYAPSASVYYLCEGKPSSYSRESLVLGVPDLGRPSIAEETKEDASALPKSRLFLGEDATEECLREHGPSSRFVHIATRMFVRPDNALFSSVRFGNSELRLFDFYQRYLPCELVGITGCSGDAAGIPNGDALVGLVRGLFYSGAAAALLSLWETPSDNTVQFLKSFYGKLDTMRDKTLAFQQAISELRKSHPHPYKWASFALFGKTS
jgi:CHAT domain-containing protein